MNIEAATMKVDWGTAQQAFLTYRNQVKSPKATREDVMLYHAYRALVRGRKVIDVHQAIAAAGLYPDQRPKLAICRADAVWCHLDTWREQGFQFVFSHRGGEFAARRRRTNGRLDLFAGEVAISGQLFTQELRHLTGRARVPLIPPQHRPIDKLENYHLLWEAEWVGVPVDPLLLKHIDGPFFVVLAAWDLTPVEQSVLRMRV